MATAPIPVHEADDEIEDLYIPDFKLVKELAQRVTDNHGKSARLPQVAGMLDTWDETKNLDLGQQEILADEIVDVLASRDNGRRR
jgi:hypothetical protein